MAQEQHERNGAQEIASRRGSPWSRSPAPRASSANICSRSCRSAAIACACCCAARRCCRAGCASAVIGDLAEPYNMAEALAEVDAVIHTAGLASTMSGLPEDDYRLFNTEATVGFARAAAAGAGQALRLSVLDQGAIRSDRRGHADRGPGAAPHRRLRPLEARGGARPRGDPISTGWRCRLALVYGPGVEGQHGKADQACPLALSAAPCGAQGRALPACPRQSGRGGRPGSRGGTARSSRPLIVADPKPLTIGAMIAAMREGLGRRAALFYVPKPLLKAALRAAPDEPRRTSPCSALSSPIPRPSRA